MKNYVSIFLVYMIVFTSCNLNLSETDSYQSNLSWLANEDNFFDSLYNEKYEEEYKLYSTSKKWDQLGLVLKAKGDQLGHVLKYDSTYVDRLMIYDKIHGKKINDSIQCALDYFLGVQYSYISNNKESEKYFKKVLANNPNEKQLFGAYCRIADFKVESNVDSAQYIISEALKLCDEHTSIEEKSNIQYSLYDINTILGDKKGAKEAFDKIVQYSKIQQDTFALISIYQTHALTLLLDFSDASYKDYQLKSDSLLNIHKGEHEYLDFYSTYFKTHQAIEKNDFVIAEKLIGILDQQADKDDLGKHHLKDMLSLRLDYLKKGKIDHQAFENLFSFYKENHYFRNIVELLQEGINARLKNNDYEMAYNYMNIRRIYQDSIWTKNKRNTVIKYEKQFENSQKEQKIAEQEQIIFKRTAWLGALVGGIVLITMIFLYYINYRKRKYAENTKNLQEQFANDLLAKTEEARSRIAGDLHDSVNHNLLNVKQKIIHNQEVVASDVEAIMQQVREISYGLFPAMFSEVGLVKCVEDLCRETMLVTNLNIATQITYINNLKPRQELQVYRIIEEMLNNIMKHSQATHAVVKIMSDISKLEIIVKDNGKGLPEDILSGKRKTFGLCNIKQRAKSINGAVELMSSEKGTQIKLTVTI